MTENMQSHSDDSTTGKVDVKTTDETSAASTTQQNAGTAPATHHLSPDDPAFRFMGHDETIIVPDGQDILGNLDPTINPRQRQRSLATLLNSSAAYPSLSSTGPRAWSNDPEIRVPLVPSRRTFTVTSAGSRQHGGVDFDEGFGPMDGEGVIPRRGARSECAGSVQGLRAFRESMGVIRRDNGNGDEDSEGYHSADEDEPRSGDEAMESDSASSRNSGSG